MAQQPDTANPYPFAEKFVVAARQVQPVVDDRHIKSMLLKRLPQALAEWADCQRSLRSERAKHTDASCCTDEVLAWLKIKSQQGGLPWMRQTNAAPSASLQSLQDRMADGLQQQQGPYVLQLRWLGARGSQLYHPTAAAPWQRTSCSSRWRQRRQGRQGRWWLQGRRRLALWRWQGRQGRKGPASQPKLLRSPGPYGCAVGGRR